MKRVQNIISESRLTLPVVAAYGMAVWAAAGLFREQWWIQLACFALSTYLMIELNNSNALIRIYSRMVSCSFIVLSSAMCFLFSSIDQAVAELCVIASYIMLFRCYQDRQAAGRTFYTFVCLGLASMFYVHTLFYIPAVWLLMAFYLQSFCWRSFVASLLGLITPYWFAAVYFIYLEDFSLPIQHFAALADFRFPYDYTLITPQQALTFAFILTIAITGTIHYLRTSYNDKIRIRMLYNCFIIMNILSTAFLIVQPQHYDFLIRMIVINASPLIAHFIALTHTRITNISFMIITVSALLLTAYNLWISSSIF